MGSTDRVPLWFAQIDVAKSACMPAWELDGAPYLWYARYRLYNEAIAERMKHA
jgi:hypothetical protein